MKPDRFREKIVYVVEKGTKTVKIGSKQYSVCNIRTNEPKDMRFVNGAVSFFEIKNLKGETEVIRSNDLLVKDVEDLKNLRGRIVSKEDRVKFQCLLDRKTRIKKQIEIIELALDYLSKLTPFDFDPFIEEFETLFPKWRFIRKASKFYFVMHEEGDKKEITWALEKVKQQIELEESDNNRRDLFCINQDIESVKSGDEISAYALNAIRKTLGEKWQVITTTDLSFWIYDDDEFEKALISGGRSEPEKPFGPTVKKKLLELQKELEDVGIKLEDLMEEATYIVDIRIVGHGYVWLLLNDDQQMVLYFPVPVVPVHASYQKEKSFIKKGTRWFTKKIQRGDEIRYENEMIVVDMPDYEFGFETDSEKLVFDYTDALALKEGEKLAVLKATGVSPESITTHPVNTLRKVLWRKLEELQSFKQLVRVTKKREMSNGDIILTTSKEEEIKIVSPEDFKELGYSVSFEELFLWGHDFALCTSARRFIDKIYLYDKKAKLVLKNRKMIDIESNETMYPWPYDRISYSEAQQILVGDVIGYKRPFTKVFVPKSESPFKKDSYFITDGELIFPEKRPYGHEWKTIWRHIENTKGIASRDWKVFLDILEGLYLDEIIYRYRYQNITLTKVKKARRIRDKIEVASKEKVMRCYGMDQHLEPILIGPRLIFKRADFFLVDTPDYGALYIFKNLRSAGRWAGGLISYQEARKIAKEEGGTVIIHTPGWEDEVSEFFMKQTENKVTSLQEILEDSIENSPPQKITKNKKRKGKEKKKKSTKKQNGYDALFAAINDDSI